MQRWWSDGFKKRLGFSNTGIAVRQVHKGFRVGFSNTGIAVGQVHEEVRVGLGNTGIAVGQFIKRLEWDWEIQGLQ